MSEYIKGDYTRCYEDICEIWYEDNLYCIVRTDDADKLIDVLNENEQLKSKNRGLQSELQIFKEDVTHSNLQINKLADENEQLYELIDFANTLITFKTSESCQTEWEKRLKELEDD